MARTTPTEWAKRVERWRDSGLAAKEFASEINVSAGTLTA
jgi:orotate phosphoribosyltransferase-like protein